MVDVIADQKDIDFVLYEQLNVERFLKHKKYSDFNKKMFKMVISEARNLAIKEILPTYTECDQEGLKFENGKVEVPKCLKRVHKLLMEGEWGALTADPEYGGQGLPHTIFQATFDYMIGANYVAMMYVILGHGAGKMIDRFGTESQKELFLEKLYSLQWGGTMLLTEPGAGSDLGALETSAEKLEDDTYSIVGNKIFISNGEQNLTENIIHPVLARIKGAPAGTKGISLFIVPKIWVNGDGTFGESNDVVCTGVEEKLGLHGSPTCSISLGSKGKCRGILLGKENQGMQIMFHMMNGVRLEVGTQAYSHASCAYLYALEYAKTRLQGKSMDKSSDVKVSQVPIIEHPDVRRMLLKMKSYVEGLRSLAFFTAFCFDMIECSENEDEKSHYSNLVEILTPIVKAYSSDRGFEICAEGMQVFGGYGYTREYPMEQLLRDCKIASIYEGSNGIQATDFLFRKVGGQNGIMLEAFVLEIKKRIDYSKENNIFVDLAETLEKVLKKLENKLRDSAQSVKTSEYKSAFAVASPLLDVTGDIVMAWHLLWRAQIADAKLAGNNGGENVDFYNGKIMAAKFFIKTILPVATGKLDGIVINENPAATINEKSF
ncbi:MAG: acyl-CoA dehydrogenase [Desulfobacteraceae bacterium]|nr:acyl-CoA dehydrogenase [Desulfobacteraceae bacterium]